MTFTRFLSDQKCSNGNNPGAYCSSEIWYSKWNGSAWAAPANLSGSNAILCNFGDSFDKKADPHACNFNQGSMPVVTSDHGAFVVWNNGNTATLLNQQLGRKINADGTLGPVVKVGQDEETNVALCDFGRGPEECVKSLNIRTNDFPAVSVDPTNSNHLVSVWQDSRGVAAGSGAYKVIVSESMNGGTSWSDAAGGGAAISGAAGDALFEPSVAITKGGHVAVSFYKANAYSGSAVGGGTFGYYVANKSGPASWAQHRVSDSGTMPSPQANASQRGFLGDYSSIAASTAADSNVVYPIWSDTRNSSSAGPDEDIFMATFSVPAP